MTYRIIKENNIMNMQEATSIMKADTLAPRVTRIYHSGNVGAVHKLFNGFELLPLVRVNGVLPFLRPGKSEIKSEGGLRGNIMGKG